jgi:hypothetical protein
LGTEIRTLDDEMFAGLGDARTELRFDDDGEHVSLVRRQGAMHMTFVRALLVAGLEHGSPGLLARVRSEIPRSMPVDELPVFRTATVLDEQHVTAGRALKNERQERTKDAKPPNH